MFAAVWGAFWRAIPRQDVQETASAGCRSGTGAYVGCNGSMHTLEAGEITGGGRAQGSVEGSVERFIWSPQNLPRQGL